MDEARQDLRAWADLIGREAVAKRFNAGKTTVTNWYNGDSPTPLEVWFVAASALEAAKNNGREGIPLEKLRRMSGVPLSNLQERDFPENPPLESAPILEELPYFKRVKEYVARCDAVGKRSGRPCKKTGNEKEICRKSDELEGRTDENLAKALGIGGKDKARSAVKILMAEREDLMQAVDDKVITVNCAETLLSTKDADAAELQRVLSKGNKKEIYAFIKERGLKPCG